MSETSVDVQRRWSLTAGQRALFASQQRTPRSPSQNMVRLAHIGAPLDAERLAAAFAEVVAASDVLRTQITTTPDGATVVRLSDDPATTEIIDIPRHEARQWAEKRAREVLPIARRAYDSALLVHDDHTVSWYLALHHCVTDAFSSTLVFQLTASVYEGESLEIPSFYAWEGLSDEGPAFERAVLHWAARPPAPKVGHLYERNRPSTAASRRVPVPIDDQLDKALDALVEGPFRSMSADHSWTTTLLSATAVHLHRITGSERFAIGVPIHNRSRPGAKSLVGPLVEVYPVDITIESDDTFETLHRRVGRALNQTVRFARAGAAPAGTDVESVVNVIPDAALSTFGPFEARVDWIHSGASDAGHLLRVQLARYTDPKLVLDINEAAASDEHASRAAQHFATILDRMATEPDGRIDQFSLLTDGERDAIESWGHGPPPPPATHVVDRLASALGDQDETAIVDDDIVWSGRQLWQHVNALAADLQAQGVGSNTRVAIEMERSSSAVVAILATLVAGGSYVPIDPQQPEARRRRLIERAGCLITLRDDLALPADGRLPQPVERSLDSEAYLLFTSGSTGEPKGVPISHRGLAGYVAFAIDRYATSENPPVVALFSALTFDLTVTSLFLPFLTGGRSIIIREHGPAGLQKVAAATEITWCKATPSHLELLVRLVPDDHALATLVVGGEAFGTALARRLRRSLPAVRIFNEYGPTEAVVGCMIHEWQPDEFTDCPDVPIGVPAPGVSLRVLDPSGQDVPPGAVGELAISLDGLTVGYLDGDTSAFFHHSGRRWYRSGDLVRMLDDVTLVYLRRADEQMKIGGIRVDPSEIEAALDSHPAVQRSAVRTWSPAQHPSRRYCVRCGLADNVPDVRYDGDGICDRCNGYEAIREQAAEWFRAPVDLLALRDRARARRTGAYDCIALLSGGKDSTYALFQLVSMGFEVYALTLDNGFISDGAKENVRRSVAALGIDHEFADTDAMAAIFRDSLERHSNVCHGCFKTIYTLGTNRAVELGAPLVVTGLSRGQLFETRLIPAQFESRRFDPDAIDAAVVAARRSYHRVDDAVRRLLDTDVFDDDELFDRIEYVDFYRYVDVDLDEMLRFLDEEAPWVRPSDTGRSTNCRINAAGIQTHLFEQGYHNYAEPYAWDVRLGHKQREQALEELDDRDDADEVAAMLAEVGYTPHRREVLTAWVETSATAAAPSPNELRAHLQALLPAHAIPAAFVIVGELPLNDNGKLDSHALPPPTRTHRSSPTLVISPTTPLERTIVELWERHLAVDAISVDDDFFALGGDSLAALEMTVMLSETLGVEIPDEIAFSNATPRALASAVAEHMGSSARRTHAPSAPEPGLGGDPPELSDGELAMLFEHRDRPDDPRYNQGRLYRVGVAIDAGRLHDAVLEVVARHQPLHWGFERPRRQLSAHEALLFEQRSFASWGEAEAAARRLHREPFDLAAGPLLRCGLFDVGDSTGIVIVTHHISTDASSFERLWNEIESVYHGDRPDPLPVSYADHTTWQASRRDGDTDRWLRTIGEVPRLALHRPARADDDGLRERTAGISADELRAVGAAPFAAVLAAVSLTMRRYCDADRVTVGALVSTRDHPSADDIVGYYLNTLPLTIPIDPDGTFATLGATCADRLVSALAHRTLPFAEIVARRRKEGLPDPTPQVLVALQELDDVPFGRHRATQEILFTGRAVADATFFVQMRSGALVLAIEHRGSEVSAEIADQLLADLDAALTALVRNSDEPVGSLDFESDSSSRLVGPEPTEAVHVVEAITDRMRERANEPAVRCGDVALSWRELDRASAAIAERLAEAGVKPSDRVIVAVPRTVELVAAIVGVLRSGAAYVPIDPTYPAERNRAIAQAANAAAVLSLGPGDEPGEPLHEVPLHQVIVSATLADPDAPADRRPSIDHDAFSAPDLDGDAYAIFTSGSTGEPRGIAVDHRALALSTAARSQVYGTDPERFLVVSSAAFDSSVAGLFWTLTTGGTVILPTDAEVHDVDALLDLIGSEKVTHTLMVPSLYRALLSRAEPRAPWPVHVIVAGEACGPDVVAEHAIARSTTRLSNEYGPTEATVWATMADLGPSVVGVPIGRPIPGVWTAVVDDRGRLCPNGVIGELLIGGATVADGYDTPGEPGSPERFAPSNELGPGRTFLTGDRAAVSAGELYFHGRRDDQLNSAGLRIEPIEIELALQSVDGVEAAVVVARDLRDLTERLATARPDRLVDALRRAAESPDPASTLATSVADDDHTTLVAHLEGDAAVIDRGALDAHLAVTLPPAARPRVMCIHDRLPRLPNGKFDRGAILDLDVATTTTPVPVTDNSVLEEMVGFFRDILGRPDIGPDDDFFDAGGESLLALELLMRIEMRYAIRPRVSVLFESRTPRTLAAALGLDGDHASHEHVEALTLRAGTNDAPPLWIWPGSDGALLIFEQLVSRLDRRILGVEYPGTRGEREPFASIEELGRYCFDAMIAAQPKGPYRMLGYSTGGLVAIDVAHRLLEHGETIDYVGVIEAGLAGMTDPRGRVAKFAEAWKDHGARFALGRSRSSMQMLSDELSARLRRTLEDRATNRFGVRPSDRRLFLRMEHALRDASMRYRPPRIDVEIDLYLGADASRHWIDAMTTGWSRVAGRGLRVTQTAGSHIRNTMLLSPDVEALAVAVDSDVARADDPDP